MVNAARAKTALRNLKATSFAKQQVFSRHAHIGEPHMHMAMRRVVHRENMHRAQDLDAGCVGRHDDLAVALMLGVILAAGFDHHDVDFAARIAGTGNPVLLTVQHI